MSDLNLSDLDSKNVVTRLEAREVLEKIFKDVVEISNANLIRNSRALIATTKFDTENFVSITAEQQKTTTADLNLIAINFFRLGKRCSIKFNSICFTEKNFTTRFLI